MTGLQSWYSLEIIIKVVQEDFSNTCKNLYWLHFPFYNNFLTIGGGGAHQILLTVTSCDVFDNLRHTDLLYIIYQYKGIIPSRYFQKCQIRFCRDNPSFIMITAQGDKEWVWNRFFGNYIWGQPFILRFRKGSFNNYVTQSYEILTYLPIFVTLFFNKISFYK